MTKTFRSGAIAALVVASIWTTPARPRAADPFPLSPGDHICIIGNTLAERIQYDGWLDTLLHARFPKHDLVIRNLGFSGDEITTRLRSKNFGTPDEWLSGKGAPIGGYEENRLAGANTRADVIFAFFGYNESYGGQEGLPVFKQQLADWIDHTVAQRYNGKSAPRIVLFSPIAHEDLHNPDLPNGRENNVRLELYTKAMGEVAQAKSVRFVDLFTPSRQLYTRGEISADDQRHPPQRRWESPDRRSHRSRSIRCCARAERVISHRAPPGRARQELPVVQSLSDDRRLCDVWRSRVPDLHSRQSARRQSRSGAVLERRRAADQLRSARARGVRARRVDGQSRQAHLGDRARHRRSQGSGSEGARFRHAAIHRCEDE